MSAQSNRLPSTPIRCSILTILLFIACAVLCVSQENQSENNGAGSSIDLPSTGETLRKIHLREGFEIELVASEPLVRDPVAIDWGPDGRLWVAEMADYPHGENGKAGRIRVLEDNNDDGTYDQSTVFLKRIRMPNGLMTWNDGVIVTSAPEIIYARDTDGDGRADESRTLYRGFKEGNPQLRINGLRWGLDNWIYGANGGHHSGYGKDTRVEVVSTGETISLGSRDFRFHPGSKELDPQSGPAQFGRVRNDQGDWFGVQNTRPLWHYVLRDHYLRRNPHVAPPNPKNQLLPISAKLRPAKPPQERFHSERHAGRFTSACGVSIYRGDLLFDGQADEHGFTCAPTHNLVYHAVLKSQGKSFSAKRANPEAKFDFLASESRFFRPVLTRTGPDGALWVVDMARYMIEHPHWLPDKAKKKLKPHYRTGEQLGRIYRVYPEDQSPKDIPTLDDRSTGELVNLLKRSSGWIRDQAQQILITSEDVDPSRAEDELKRLFRNTERPMARLHALCTHDGIGKLEPNLLIKGVNDEHPAVRRHAVRISESWVATFRAPDRRSVIQEILRLSDDPNSKVRQQLAFSLGAFKKVDDELKKKIGRTLGRMAVREGNDEYMRASVLSSVPFYLPAVVDTVTEHELDETEPLILPLLATAEDQPGLKAQLLRPVVERGKKPSYRPVQMRITAEWLDRLNGDVRSISSTDSDRNDPLAHVREKIESMIEAARNFVTNREHPMETRLAASHLLGRQPSSYKRDLKLLEKLLEPDQPLTLQKAAVDSAVRLPGQHVSRLYLSNWNRQGPEIRRKILDKMLSRNSLTRDLLVAAREGRISLQLDASRRQRLLNHDKEDLQELAKTVIGSDETSSRQEVVDEYRSALDLSGKNERGKRLFRKNCSSCHQLDDVGTNVGPDLRALTDTSSSALLQAVLDPNRRVDPRYSSYVVQLKDGEILLGVIKKETSNSVTVADAKGQKHQVLRSEIKSMKRTGRSLMPDGLEQNLSKQNLADLIEYIQQSDRD